MLIWTIATLLTVATADAGVADAGTAAANVVDFTDDEGISGGEEFTAGPSQPLEHESLLPDRYRGPADAGAALVAPAGPRRRGCGGCAAGGNAASAPVLLSLVAGLAWRVRRRRVLS